METIQTKCLIIGSGPAGYTAAIYASRANLEPIVIEGLQPGGQLTTTTEIENFPGYPNGITGPEMMEELRSQASRLGADIRTGVVTEVDFSVYPLIAKTDSGQVYSAQSVIIATGATAKYLGLDDEKKYAGMGVSACATCDGFFYRKKVVAVVGGGDTACEEASYLSNLASKVYLIVRKDYLRASKAMQQRVFDNPKIEILFNTNTVGLFGDNGVEGAHLVKFKGTDQEESLDISIGHKPNTDVFKQFIDLDEQGYIKTVGVTTATNVPGVFAAGDVADPIYRQAITSAGMGAKAAIDAEKFVISHK